MMQKKRRHKRKQKILSSPSLTLARHQAMLPSLPSHCGTRTGKTSTQPSLSSPPPPRRSLLPGPPHHLSFTSHVASGDLQRIPTLSTNQLQMVIKFHQYIFSTCLALTDLLGPLDLPAPLLVPVLAGDLDLGDLSALCRKISARQSGSHVKVNSHAISAHLSLVSLSNTRTWSLFYQAAC